MTAFSAIRIEGGLLGPEIFEQLLAGGLPGQRPQDFGLDPRRNLTDEIAAAFADVRQLWGVFQNRLGRLAETDLATGLTRDVWMIPFLRLLGYELRYNHPPYRIEDARYPISHRAGEAEDALPVHIVGARQELGRLPPSGRPRLSPHALMQEYLNRSEQLWGIVTNGLSLRLLRDSTLIRRQSYVEFDLEAILEEQRFQDFAVLYRLLHRTRLPYRADDAPQSLIEQYYQQAIEQGGRVRERLREGVEECLRRLADGFLAHPANTELRARLLAAEGRVAIDSASQPPLAAADLYRELLRLVYRCLFLLVSEDRGLISANPIYREHYGIARLRRLLDRRSAYDDHDDLWQGLRVLWRLLADERLASLLEVAPLNGELFAPLVLDTATISNRDLLSAFWHLAYYREDGRQPWRRVNYAALDVEELGAVYESLLEFHPAIEMAPGGRIAFQLLEGSERKTTGSYYTPPPLVNELIASALAPVIDERLAAAPDKAAKERALLSLKVCDPACGSGHFLLAAARRLGKELARLRSGEDEPAPERLREATREVIAHCIYGVDKNPLAVDLCRVALWLEGHAAGKPLSFLDHRIRCGDSLIGVFDLEVLKGGIPDAAFEPLAGDDRTVARQAVRLNRAERDREDLIHLDLTPLLNALCQQARALDALADDTPEAVREKWRRFEDAHADVARQRLEEACHLWTAAFYQPLSAKAQIITTRTLADQLAGRTDPQRLGLARAIAERERVFHWPLEFPEVFAQGGFDVILSNPPWERIKLQEQEFFAARDARIARAPTKAARSGLIRALPKTDPALYAEYQEALRSAEAASRFLRHAGRFPLAGRGDINTYAVFAELTRALLAPGGRAGIIVPTGIATDDTTKYLFGDLVRQNALVSLFDFENRKKIFPAIDSRMKFALLTLQRAQPHTQATGKGAASFCFFALTTDDLRRPEKRFSLTPEEIALINPNTGNCPIFRTQADAELTKAIYRRVPVLWREARDGEPEVNPWQVSLRTMFHMANDSHLFRTAFELEGEGYRRDGNLYILPSPSGRRAGDERYLLLYEAKMLHQFDHRWATYETRGGEAEIRDVTAAEKSDTHLVVQPRYWVPAREVLLRSARLPRPLIQALRENDAQGIAQGLAGVLFGKWLAEMPAGAPRPGLFAAWRAFAERFPFAHRIAPGRLDLVGAGPGRRSPAGQDDLPSITLTELTTCPHAEVRWHAADPEAIARLIETVQDIPLRLDELPPLADTAEVIQAAELLLERATPNWFLGWRDICRSTDERTLIASVLPRVGVGHTAPLMFLKGIPAIASLAFLAILNSLATDFVTRQKVGGTHITYNLLKQFPFLTPPALVAHAPWHSDQILTDWICPRVLELVYTAHDLAPLARELGDDGPPFVWDPERRFELRCELDAAFFHLYLPADGRGQWRPARRADGHVVDETEQQLAALRSHFPSPRHAVAYILDQFPLVRQKDEARFGHYRTKDRILALYDAMQEAQAAGRPYVSPLAPPQGLRR